MNGFFGLLSCYSFSCGEHAFSFMNGSFLSHMNGLLLSHMNGMLLLLKRNVSSFKETTRSLLWINEE